MTGGDCTVWTLCRKEKEEERAIFLLPDLIRNEYTNDSTWVSVRMLFFFFYVFGQKEMGWISSRLVLLARVVFALLFAFLKLLACLLSSFRFLGLEILYSAVYSCLFHGKVHSVFFS